MKFSDICGVCGTVNIYLLERMIDDHIQDLMVHDITFRKGNNIYFKVQH